MTDPNDPFTICEPCQGCRHLQHISRQATPTTTAFDADCCFHPQLPEMRSAGTSRGVLARLAFNKDCKGQWREGP